MATLTTIDYVSEGLGRLLSQFKDKPRIAAFLTAWLTEIQHVEDAAFAIYVNRQLQSGLATGDLLAKLGKLVGQGNDGLSDSQFRVLISARIRTNRSDGKRNTLITIASILVPGVQIVVRDYPPAEVWVTPQAVPPVPANIIANEFLFRAVEAGTYLVYVYLTQPPVNTFTFKNVFDPSASIQTKSFADSITPNTGGFFAGAASILGGP